MNLEDDLKRVLSRESPAPGFASRVMLRIERDAVPKRRRAFVRQHWRAVAASLALTALLGGGVAYEEQQRRIREGEEAKEQVLVALRIAGEKVRYAQNEVRAIGSND